jgi:anti-sigma factor RsiW
MNCELCRNQLDAYVDGELAQQDFAAVESHIGECHACAAEALRRMQLKRATRDASQHFTPSPELRAQIGGIIAPKPTSPNSPNSQRSLLWRPAFAAVCALLIVVAVSSMLLMHHAARHQAMSEILDLHVATLASPNPVDVVSTDRHTVKPWFQGKLPFTFNLPELQNSPYRLLGGKLVYFHDDPAAQLLFEERKHRFSVFIVQDTDSALLKPAFSKLSGQSRERGFSAESWNAGGLRCTIVSDAAAYDVHQLAALMRSAQSQ